MGRIKEKDRIEEKGRIKEKDQNTNSCEIRAAVTIEASLLMPLILGSIVFVIYTGFYLHGKCMLQKAGETALLRGGSSLMQGIYDGSLQEGSTKSRFRESVSAGEEAIKEITEKKMIGPWQTDSDVKVTDGRVSVKLEGRMKYERAAGSLMASGGSVYPGYRFFRTEPVFDSAGRIRSIKKRGEGYAVSGSD